MSNQYNVRLHLNNGLGTTMIKTAKVEFYCDPDQYGNGYSMWIESELEPLGGQEYDLRYNDDFDSKRMISFIANLYENRFDGTGGCFWKLISIKISEAEFTEE